MQFKQLSVIAVLASFAAASSSPFPGIADVARLELPETLFSSIKLKDANGTIIGERPYTIAEQALFANMTGTRASESSAVKSRAVNKRGGNDIAFYVHQWQSCYIVGGDGGCTYYSNIVAAYWGFGVCDAPNVTRTHDNNGCHTPFFLYGNWYFMNNCDPNVRIWDTLAHGSYVGGLLTWNDRWVGNCYADRTYHENNRCYEPWYSDIGIHSFQKVIRCDIS